jgi:hypothetical protein
MCVFIIVCKSKSSTLCEGMLHLHGQGVHFPVDQSLFGTI